jgi:hypothetical protein
LLGGGGAGWLVFYCHFRLKVWVFRWWLLVRARARALEAGQQAAPADTPWLALAVFAVLLAGALVVAARGPRERLLELTAGLITFFMLFALRWRMPWYFLTGIALMAAAPRTRVHRILAPVVFGLGVLAMLLYCALVPIT